MSQTSIAVWFVCRLCRGSFGQVDAFIEHKKQKHFNEFQNTSCIVFEETKVTEHGLLHPEVTNADHQLADEINEPLIKVEANENELFIPFSSETINEPNLNLFEPKSELITFEYEINPDNENNLFGSKKPKQNPYVLLKRLTSEEIQNACVPKHHSTLLKFEQENFTQPSEPNYLFVTSSTKIDHNQVEKCTEIQPTANVPISPEHDLQFECKLCSKQLESAAQLKIHVGICALHHEDRGRFCVLCNRKLCSRANLKLHRLRLHGTEKEKLSLYKVKCHVCPQQFRQASHLRLHLQSHTKKKQVKTSKSKSHKCSHPNCGKAFRCNYDLQTHIAAIHLGVRPFSCDFPNCNKRFALRSDLKRHLRTHTGERPYKCTVDNCNKAFTSSQNRSLHQIVHFNL